MKGTTYDFDGFGADREVPAKLVLAEGVTPFGPPTTLDAPMTREAGERWCETAPAIEAGAGCRVPSNFLDGLKIATFARFREALGPVPGAEDFILRFAILPCCIASSSLVERLRLCMEVLAFGHHFPDAVYSADAVPRGKAHPEFLLHAAAKIGVAPEPCLVTEDSRPHGVRADVAASMCVAGLCAGAPVRAGQSAVAGCGPRACIR